MTRRRQKTHRSLDLILTVVKPVGWTSFDVVRRVRSLLRVGKVGHAGTLDPFASGLLVLGIGRKTKEIHRFIEADKEYVAKIELGRETSTDDVEGVTVFERPLEGVDLPAIEAAAERFRGEIEQLPPDFSAVHVQGVRAYKLARRGIKPRLEPRKVVVRSLEILRFDKPVVEVRVVCSKGTYMRALARDLGRELGCGAHLRSLVRTRVGPFRIEDALSIEDVERRYGAGRATGEERPGRLRGAEGGSRASGGGGGG